MHADSLMRSARSASFATVERLPSAVTVSPTATISGVACALAHADRAQSAPCAASALRPLAHRLGAFAGGGRVAGQVIADLEPLDPFGDMRVPRRRPLLRVGQGAVEEVNFARPARSSVGHGRAAAGAEEALDVG